MGLLFAAGAVHVRCTLWTPLVADNPPMMLGTSPTTIAEPDFTALDRPWSSVTVSVGMKEPTDAYLWLGVAPVPGVPSPKFQLYDATDPLASFDALAPNDTGVPARAFVKDCVNAATGVMLVQS